MADTGATPAPVPISLNVQLVVQEGMPLTYADHTGVTGTEAEVVFSFFQVGHPIGLVKSGGTIKAYCVARMVLTVPRARLLFDNLGAALGILPGATMVAGGTVKAE